MRFFLLLLAIIYVPLLGKAQSLLRLLRLQKILCTFFSNRNKNYKDESRESSTVDP